MVKEYQVTRMRVPCRKAGLTGKNNHTTGKIDRSAEALR